MTRPATAGDARVTSTEVEEELALAITLVVVAGWVDAIGFLRLGHLFISFMSGNSTVFAVSLGRTAWTEVRWAGSIIALFVIGVMLGRVVCIRAERWRRPIVLALVGTLLTLAAVAERTDVVAIPAMVLGMGIQNAALRKAGETKTSLTYVTGTLVAFAEKLTDMLAAETAERWAWLPYLLLWLGIVLGALGGSLAYRALGMMALIAPILVVASLTILSAWQVARSPGSGRPRLPV